MKFPICLQNYPPYANSTHLDGSDWTRVLDLHPSPHPSEFWARSGYESGSVLNSLFFMQSLSAFYTLYFFPLSMSSNTSTLFNPPSALTALAATVSGGSTSCSSAQLDTGSGFGQNGENSITTHYCGDAAKPNYIYWLGSIPLPSLPHIPSSSFFSSSLF